MIQFKSMRQYTHVVDGVRFPQNPKSPFVLIYFSENSSLLDDYPKLNLKIIDFRDVVVPITIIPRTRLTPDLKKLYKDFNLLSFSLHTKIPQNRNIILDLSPFLISLDSSFTPTDYRKRAGFLIKDVLFKSLIRFPETYQKVFLYSIDNTKEFNKFINRKIFPIIQDLKNSNIVFNDMLLNVNGETSSYRLLMKDKSFKLPRVIQYIKNIKTVSPEELNSDIEKASNFLMKKLSGKINPENSLKIKGTIIDFLKNDKDAYEQIMSGDVSDDFAEKTATASIMYRMNNDIDSSKKLLKTIPKNRSLFALKAMDKNYGDELLKPQKTSSVSIDPLTQIYDIPSMLDNKSPEHIFQKRQIDFETNLRKDMINSFKLLENQDPPLKFEKLEIIEKKQRSGELYKSDINIIRVFLSDQFGNKHSIDIEVPRINANTGTFRINGQTKCLINQIIQCPITFPKPGQSRFESAYAIFRIESRKLRREEFLESYIGAYKLPFSILTFFSFGFKETMKLYGIDYEIVDRKIKKEEKGSKITETSSIIFKNLNSKLKEEFVQSFIRFKVNQYETESEFGTFSYFEELITHSTGRLNGSFVVKSILQNIVDPVVKQILISKQQPFELSNIMKYMAEKSVEGFVIDRNDLSNQRIRNSEVLVSLAQKQMLSSYTIYKEQVLSGNEKANFDMAATKVLSDFINLELVTNMEYANPIEEMATITRVSPVGKAVGGIPDKRAIATNARNVHNSYFGNIDPLDTPEGPNIGITQQLTIDAHLTSARGLIASKGINENENSGMLSTTTCMIPFLENNDGARVIMLANQSRQMLPLKNPTPPAVISGYESVLTNTLSDNFVKRSPTEGKIGSISSSIIIVIDSKGKKHEVDISPVHLKSGSGKDSLSIFKSITKTGQKVNKNTIIAEGGCLSEGSISLGKNMCVAMMPYKGYNFEDGIVVNEKILGEGTLTSVHGIEESIILNEKDRLLFIEKIGSYTEKGEPLLKRTMGEIEELIGYEDDESVDMAGRQVIHKSPGGKIVDIEVFSNVAEDTFPELKKLIEKTNRKYKPENKKYTEKGRTIQGVLIKFRIEQELPIGLGDKLCNRYGNKGIISLIEKDQNMPKTPTGDRVDIIFNPIGLIGRMNMGQLYEMYCGLISKEMARQIIKFTTKKQVITLIKKVFTQIDTSKDQRYSIKAILNIEKLNDKKFKEFINQIKKTDFFPLVIPPFKAPNYKNIINTLKILGLKTSYNLKLPEYNTKTKNAVPYGYMYISKLEHIGENKLSARSTGPMTGKTAQPTAGRKKLGGQRLGELDSYSFLSYNSTACLSELMGPLSDDFVTKDEIISEVVQTGGADFRPAKANPSKDLLNSYFVSLMLDRS